MLTQDQRPDLRQLLPARPQAGRLAGVNARGESCGGGGGSYNKTGGNGVSQSCYNGADGYVNHNKTGGCGGGGGGVGGPGGHGGGHCTYNNTSKTDGGDGLQSNITGSFEWYGGGGAGCSIRVRIWFGL